MRQEDQKIKASLGYIASSRPDLTTYQDPLRKQKKNTQVKRKNLKCILLNEVSLQGSTVWFQLHDILEMVHCRHRGKQLWAQEEAQHRDYLLSHTVQQQQHVVMPFQRADPSENYGL